MYTVSWRFEYDETGQSTIIESDSESRPSSIQSVVVEESTSNQSALTKSSTGSTIVDVGYRSIEIEYKIKDDFFKNAQFNQSYNVGIRKELDND
jgi:hypothetical protein